MPTWEEGVEFGRTIEKLKNHEHRMDLIEYNHQHLQTEVTEAKALAMRVALVVLLWLGALAIGLPAEKGGEFLAGFLRSYLKL